MVSDTIKHLGLWVLGRFLPKEHVLERHARNFAKAAMLMVMGGLIVTAVFIGGLIGLHTYLTSQGLQQGLSMSIIGVIALLAASVCFMKADRIIGDIIPDKEDLTPRGLPSNIQVDVAVQEGISIAVAAFLAGFRGRNSKSVAPVQPDLFEIEGDEDIIHLHPREKRHR